MKAGVLALFGAFLATMTVQASNPCPSGGLTCIAIANGNNAVTGGVVTLTTQNATVDLSPYTGTLSQTVGGVTTSSSLTLYCDDLNNTFPTGANENVNVTQVTGSLTNTKFDTQNPTGASGNLSGTSIPIPAGTTLYEEEAWLFTQIMNLPTGTGSTANMTALTEAAWELTSNNLTSAEDTNAKPWLTAAYNAVTSAGTNGSSVNGVVLHSATYADWFILTDPNYANNDSSSGNQEFMAYSAGTMQTTQQATPEPATFWLLGGGLLLSGAFVRRRALSAAK
jgi:hypothetical protein